MAKYSFEFKKKVVQAYLSGEGGYAYLAEKYGVKKERQVFNWAHSYEKLGDNGLLRSRGSDFNILTRKKVNLIMNHINSTKRVGMGNRSPYELIDPNDSNMQLLFKELKMDIIPPDDVHLMPDLIK